MTRQNFAFATLLEEIKYIKHIISEENLLFRLHSKCTTELAWSNKHQSSYATPCWILNVYFQVQIGSKLAELCCVFRRSWLIPKINTSKLNSWDKFKSMNLQDLCSPLSPPHDVSTGLVIRIYSPSRSLIQYYCYFSFFSLRCMCNLKLHYKGQNVLISKAQVRWKKQKPFES